MSTKTPIANPSLRALLRAKQSRSLPTPPSQIANSLRRAPVLLVLLISAAAAAPPTTIRYTCTDGRIVTATYPDQATAILAFADQTLTLTIAPSADGARYIGHSWQWWSKGMRDASLAPLAVGETIASAPGTPCHVEKN
jgi:membrane-bound inhibitor of C-type lysozyme